MHWKLYIRQEERVAEFHLENGIGEELHGEWNEYGKIFQITRHQANRNTKKMWEWIKAKTEGRKDRTIWIYNPTVG